MTEGEAEVEFEGEPRLPPLVRRAWRTGERDCGWRVAPACEACCCIVGLAASSSLPPSELLLLDSS